MSFLQSFFRISSAYKGKNIDCQTVSKDPPSSYTKSVPPRIGIPWEISRDYFRSKLSHDQAKKPLVTTTSYGKKTYNTLVRESILALPILSSSGPTSTFSSQGLLSIIRILVTMMKVQHPKKKCDSKGEPIPKSKRYPGT